ncbi:hypothetical protein [Mechercharimyces sp. CAU 1602]|uniref:hypothetical protein n=1 Tax=Mechercharimyces sp. CAU 1602 TaxID=2973933 RepID=UPI0021627DD2|nr:hypothetical protein [Mechercharimyces sp. CAU 1602]MCS1352767.1 hypothetical protein [Mechercharimyces sp. CAU 1602]
MFKRSIAIMMAVMMLFTLAIPSVFATTEEAKLKVAVNNDGTITGTFDKTVKEAEGVWIVRVTSDEKDLRMQEVSQIKDIKGMLDMMSASENVEISGDVDNTTTGTSYTSTQKFAELNKEGKHYIHISFAGQINGEETVRHSEILPYEMKLNEKKNDDEKKKDDGKKIDAETLIQAKVNEEGTVTASFVDSVQTANGRWAVRVAPDLETLWLEETYQENNLLLDNLPSGMATEFSATGLTELSYTTIKTFNEFNIVGKYYVQVTFGGTVNGETGVIHSEPMMYEVKQKENEEKRDHNFSISADHEWDEGVFYLYANVMDLNADQVEEGEFTFEIEGLETKKVKLDGMSGSVEYALNNELMEGTKYNAHITFKGVVDGKEVEEETSYAFGVQGLKISYEKKDGKHVFAGELLEAIGAEGDWYMVIADAETKEVVEQYELLDAEGIKQENIVEELSHGKYVAGMYFEGQTEDEYENLWDVTHYSEVEFEVSKKGVEIIPEKEEKSTIVTDLKEKEEIKEQLKGGKLPSTATEEPKGMLYGLIAAALGLFVLGFVFRKKIVGMFR